MSLLLDLIILVITVSIACFSMSAYFAETMVDPRLSILGFGLLFFTIAIKLVTTSHEVHREVEGNDSPGTEFERYKAELAELVAWEIRNEFDRARRLANDGALTESEATPIADDHVGPPFFVIPAAGKNGQPTIITFQGNTDEQ